MKLTKAIFAAGCFWHVQFTFSEMKGVVKTMAGYCGGRVANPTYEQVCSGKTGHSDLMEDGAEDGHLQLEIIHLAAPRLRLGIGIKGEVNTPC